MKTKTLPKEIRMFSKRFKIIYLDRINEVDETGEAILYGRIDLQKNEIRIYNNHDGYEEADIYGILFHELLHGIFINLDINVPDTEEERIINLISLGLTHILLENKLDFSGKNKKNT